MSTAKTSIVFALKALKNLHEYLTAKIKKPMMSETTSDGKGGELLKQYTDYDLQVSRNEIRTSAGRFEAVHEFCLARDYRNTRRSRRYLYMRGHQERMRAALSTVMEFAAQNPDMDLEKLVKQNPDILLTVDYQTLKRIFV